LQYTDSLFIFYKVSTDKLANARVISSQKLLGFTKNIFKKWYCRNINLPWFQHMDNFLTWN